LRHDSKVNFVDFTINKIADCDTLSDVDEFKNGKFRIGSSLDYIPALLALGCEQCNYV
tara:strand:- start:954 stop:1127 length:174 start_codon:yes stop_codon:yes gene_type:complete